jgi:hypothetical protein
VPVINVLEAMEEIPESNMQRGRLPGRIGGEGYIAAEH